MNNNKAIPIVNAERMTIELSPDNKPSVDLGKMEPNTAMCLLAVVLHDLVKRNCQTRGQAHRQSTPWESMALLTTQAAILPTRMLAEEVPQEVSRIITPMM